MPIYRAALVKLLENKKDYTYNEVLKNTSLHVPDRKVLYHFIQKKTTPLKIVEEPIEDEMSPIQVESKKEIDTSEIKEEIKIEQKIEVAEKEVELVSEEIEVQPTAIEPVEESATELDIVETIEAKTENIQLEKEVAGVIPLETKSVSIESKVEIPSGTIKVESSDEEEHSFEDWLDFLDDHKVDTSAEEQLSEQIEVHMAASTYEAELNEEVADTDEQEDDEDALSEADALQVTNLATDSITLTTGAVTETLAKIMLMQGKINEAIAMYKQLGLKFPEKSNYFAAQIELIKKK